MGLFWNCWVRFINAEDGCVIHVCEEGSETDARGRAICGVSVTEHGGIELGTEGFNEPGCKRCTAILKRRGVLPLIRPAAATL
jgi:hypothetical protein